MELQREAPRCRADPILARVLAYSYLSLLIQLDIGPSLLAFLSTLCGAIDNSVGLRDGGTLIIAVLQDRAGPAKMQLENKIAATSS